MSLACLWCDAPLRGPIAYRLCDTCAPHGDTLFHCHAGLGHPPTFSSVSCGQCDDDAARKARIVEARAPQLAELRKIREDLVTEVREGKRWLGLEWGKSILGRSIDAAIADLEKVE